MRKTRTVSVVAGLGALTLTFALTIGCETQKHGAEPAGAQQTHDPYQQQQHHDHQQQPPRQPPPQDDPVVPPPDPYGP